MNQDFTHIATEPLSELSGTAHIYRHRSGARVMWLDVDDDNRSFAIAFKTPPANSTGVFHILEHSVLCGSERFPVKEPFVNLIKTSMQTFLNAMTFPDKTIYPVASTNVRDLENLMDVYLDAVLHPAIYRRPRIFEQEGWHLEATDEGVLSYNGVVYNEMQGALSNPDEVLMQALNEQLFPQTAYGFESGGDPKVIPSLSYEEFLDTHARHYTLENSYTILYGNLDIERELAFIGARFDGARTQAAGAPNPLALQAPVTPALRRVEMVTSPDNATIGLAYVLGTAAERERVLAVDVLLDALTGSNEAPLKRAVLDSGLGDDLSAYLMDATLQPVVIFDLKGARPQVAQEFRTLVEDTCRRLCTDGIEHQRLVASLAQAEFNLREGDFGGVADGVALSMAALSSWLYDDDRPVDYLRYQDAIDHMRDQLDQGYFETLLLELVPESAHNAEVELAPVEQAKQDGTAGPASMGAEGLERVRAEVAALRDEQEAPDAPEDLAKLPRLSVTDIGDAPAEQALCELQAPLPCLYHELRTHRITYAYHYFDLRHLSLDDLPYVGVLATLLGNLDTAAHTAAELDMLVEEQLGDLSFFTNVYATDEADETRPFMVASASALSEHLDALATLPTEVWGTTSFADGDRIFEQLMQQRVGLDQYFTGAGHSAGMARLSTHYSRGAALSDRMSGIDYYLFVKDLLANWDERADDLAERLGDLCRRIFVADGVTVSLTGSMADCTRFWELGGTLGLSAAAPCDTRLEMPQPTPTNEAFVIPSTVSYVCEGDARAAGDQLGLGTWQVISRVLSYDYLWNAVRVRGGAYGVGFRRTPLGLRQFWSYRDPSVDDTLARYEGTASWLAAWDGGPEEFEGYIVSTVAGHDAPLKARALARRQDGDYFAGRPATWRDRMRAQMLAVTADDIRAAAKALEGLPHHHAVCVFGPREAIEASRQTFEVTELVS